jgi:glycosyltransferase involved in cell wall biosynthesis
MFEGLGSDVSTLVTELEADPLRVEGVETVVVREDLTRHFWRVLRKIGMISSGRKSVGAVRTVSKALESDEVTVAFVHYVTTAVNYRKVWKKSSKPVYVHCHGYDVTWDLRRHENPDVRVHAPDYVSQIRNLPDHVHFIANSRRTAERVREIGIPEGRIHMKYLGVPIPRDPPARRTTRDEITVLYLGRLVDFKGPELVVEAFVLACERGLKGRLVLAGDGPMRNDCERARAASKYAERIEILGAVDGARGERLRREADVFAAHNRVGPDSRQEEAFGVSLVEAMAAGLPVVTGRNGSVPEVVEDGKQGYLVEPGDVEAQAECFLKFAESPELRGEMGLCGWKRARDNFSIETEMATLRAILASRE